jgi:hypothetical protein
MLRGHKALAAYYKVLDIKAYQNKQGFHFGQQPYSTKPQSKKIAKREQPQAQAPYFVTSQNAFSAALL